MNKRNIKFILVLLLAFIVLRLSFLLPTTNKYYLGPFRIGIQPINDALYWIDSSRDMLQGIKSPGRPMLPLILSILAVLFNNDFVFYIAFFILINAIGFLVAFYLLKDIRNNIFIVSFLSFLSVWNIYLNFSIATEVLAGPFLAVAFALIVRAIFYSSYNSFFPACFLIAVAQTIRPWDFLSLATLSLFPLAFKGFSKKTLILSFSAVLMMTLGVSYYLFATKMYCIPETNEVFAMRIWAQTFGGTSTYDIYKNEDIAVATLKNEPKSQIIKMLYKNAFGQIKKHPEKLIEAFVWTLAFFFRDIPNALGKEKIGGILYLLLMFFIFFVYFYDNDKKKAILSSLKKWQIFILLIPATALLCFKTQILLMGFAIIGLFYLLFSKQKSQKALIALYLIGIIVSLIFNGAGGGDREWMSIELLLYYFASLGIFSLVNGFKEYNLKSNDFTLDARKCVISISVLFLSMLIFFILTPSFLRIYTERKITEAPLIITDELIKQKLNINTPILSPEEIKYFLLKWPEPSFETVNGIFCYVGLRYREYHALYFKPNEGIINDSNEYWPLKALPFSRTIYIKDKIIFPGADTNQLSRFEGKERIIFPNITKSELSRFEGKEIAVFGQLIARKKFRFTDAGYALFAMKIGYMDDAGQVEWIDLNKL